MKLLGKLLVAGMLALPAPIYASPPMPAESIDVIAAALPECTGGWIEIGKQTRGRVFPTDLTSRIALLSRPSIELNQEAGMDLYKIAIGLLAPATGTPDWMVDGSANLKCSAHPREAVALLEYLMGKKPDDRRGASNAYEWLGLAYETGAAGVQDPAKARRNYLLFRMHSFSRGNRWTDGTDDSLLGNIQRAGLRPYLEALAQTERSGGIARLALAEEALPTDPAKARRLLLYLDDRSLKRLLELEEQKRVPIVADREEVGFWAEAARTLFGYRKYAARMLKAAQEVNGGSIPLSTQQPSIDLLRPHLDMANVTDADATRAPVPVRALVNPDGRAIYIEACSAQPAQSMPIRNLNVLLDASRLYNVRNISSLPKLPIVRIKGSPAYGWVILPAVHFTRTDSNKLVVNFAKLPPDRCVYSGIADAPPPPVIH